jgi:hypothetical protein
MMERTPFQAVVELEGRVATAVCLLACPPSRTQHHEYSWRQRNDTAMRRRAVINQHGRPPRIESLCLRPAERTKEMINTQVFLCIDNDRPPKIVHSDFWQYCKA